MEGAEGTQPKRTAPRRATVLALAVAGAVLSVLVVLAVGGAVAGQLEDDPPVEVTITQPTPVSTTTTEPASDVVLAPPASVDNTTSVPG